MDNTLAGINCLLFDMDGTIYLGHTLLPGVLELFQLLDQRQFPYYFLTNNSSRSKKEYVQKLAGLGLSTRPANILTSGEAAAVYIQKHFPEGRIFLVGTPSLEQEFREFGFSLTDQDPDLAVLGFDTTLTYNKLAALVNFLMQGLPYIATHPDINCPVKDGFIPDTGSFIALIKASTGREPDKVIGKPHLPIVDAVLSKTGFKPNQILMVGDRLYTDIALGVHGLRTALVLTGEAKEKDIAAAPYKPDYVFAGLPDLRQAFVKSQL